MTQDHRYAMIMAGGSGTRLWPMSRTSRPKQLIPFIESEVQSGDKIEKKRKSLLQISGERLEGLVAKDHRLVCASRSYAKDVIAAIDGLSQNNFLGEPVGRDTLNAVGFAAAVLAARDPDAIFAVLTSDHIIEPQSVFTQKIDLGFRLVEADPSRIVTFSITPTFPATAYGYVEQGDPISDPTGSNPSGKFDGAFRANRFVEKPDLARATEYFKSGSFGWNSGMFIFHARTVLDAIAWFQPASAVGLAKIGAAWGKPGAEKVVEDVYPLLTKISVDYGLMEPAARDERIKICAVPMPVSWRDVGSWPSYGEILTADADGNRASARVLHIESKKMIVVSDDPAHLIATIGVEGLVVVHTKDATLICRADMAEQVKDLAGRVAPELR